MPSGFGVRLYDGRGREANLLARTATAPARDGETVIERVAIGAEPWTLEVTAADGGGLSGLSMVTMIFGMLVASLLMLLVRMLTQQAIEDEASLRWFEEQASIRNSLTRELNHRVKNTLANVLSIIALDPAPGERASRSSPTASTGASARCRRRTTC